MLEAPAPRLDTRCNGPSQLPSHQRSWWAPGPKELEGWIPPHFLSPTLQIHLVLPHWFIPHPTSQVMCGGCEGLRRDLVQPGPPVGIHGSWYSASASTSQSRVAVGVTASQGSILRQSSLQSLLIKPESEHVLLPPHGPGSVSWAFKTRSAMPPTWQAFTCLGLVFPRGNRPSSFLYASPARITGPSLLPTPPHPRPNPRCTPVRQYLFWRCTGPH